MQLARRLHAQPALIRGRQQAALFLVPVGGLAREGSVLQTMRPSLTATRTASSGAPSRRAARPSERCRKDGRTGSTACWRPRISAGCAWRRRASCIRTRSC